MTKSPSTHEVPRFPIYIHSSMMMSFLAYLDDGVSNEAEVQSQSQSAKSKQGTAGLSAKLSAFSTIFGLAADARASKESSSSDTEIRQERKQHTNASLFNLLYDVLNESGLITQVSSAEDLNEIEHGAIIEIEGRFVGNPLEDSFSMMRKFMNISDSVQDAVDATNAEAKHARKAGAKSGNPATKAQANEPAKTFTNPLEMDRPEAALVRAILSDLGDSPVADFVVEGPDELEVVVSVVRSECPGEVLELMQGSQIKVLGKATNFAQDPEDQIDLMRRSSLSVVKSDDDSLSPLLDMAGGQGRESRYVEAPAVQVIPMGIYC